MNTPPDHMCPPRHHTIITSDTAYEGHMSMQPLKTSFGLTLAPNQVGHEFTWVDDRHTISVTSDTTKDGLKVDAALDTVDVRQPGDWNPEV